MSIIRVVKNPELMPKSGRIDYRAADSFPVARLGRSLRLVNKRFPGVPIVRCLYFLSNMGQGPPAKTMTSRLYRRIVIPVSF